MNYKVSIYVPAFNAEKTIEYSIKSVQDQSLAFDEIIIVDDHSTDNTSEIVKKFHNIKLITNSKNMGLGFNRNLAIKNCKNEIIAAIDADVVLDKFWLENILKTFEKDKITMSGGKMIEKNVDNKFNSWRSRYYSQNWGNKNILNPPFLYGCNTIQNKSIWNKINGYDEKMLTNGEDVDYSKKIKLQHNFELLYCPSAICHHLQDDNLESLSNRIWRYHSFGYKIKQPSFYRFIKLSLKQFKFLFQRFLENLLKFNFYFIYISLQIFLKFISLELKNYLKNKK